MNEDFELLLFDRLEAIRTVNKKFDLENNAYISFSGGKDSVILSKLIDEAIPNNQIKRVYIDTGIEYEDIRKYVLECQKNDHRIVIIKPGKPIKQTLEKYGYPFKSKEHSLRVEQFNKGHNSKFIKKYIRKTDYIGKYVCPKMLMYQFEEKGKYNYSNKCCYELKKKTAHKWQKENKKTMTITGMRREEGGNRTRLGCLSDNNKKFHPLIVVNEEFENFVIEKYKIKLCRLYYPPFNFKRTGCKGCPFALDLQEQLTIMELYLPNERKQCEFIWQPVYDEYRRLGYRLKRNEQLKLF